MNSCKQFKAMNIEEEILKDMRAIGCKSKSKAALAFQLFIHLSEEKILYDLKYFYNSKLDLIFIKGKQSKTPKTGVYNIYVPALVSEAIDLNYITELQKELCIEDEIKRITLGCIDSDSTIVLYSFTKGLLDVKEANTLFRQKTREERKDFIKKELYKNRELYLREAYNGGVIDDLS